MRSFTKILLKGFLTLCLIAPLAACSSDDSDGPIIQTEARYPGGYDRGLSDDIYEKPGSIFGEGGLGFGLGKNSNDSDSGAGIGVNSFLWRATLDTISFMPIASADPFGGTILTDWYTPDSTKNERFKVNVFILGKQLRSDGVRVRAFQQVLKNGAWVDTAAPEDMGRKLEDAILTRARQIRVAQID